MAEATLVSTPDRAPRQKGRLHPLTLAFTDPAVERRYRAEHNRRAIQYLRVLLVFLTVLAGALGALALAAGHFARQHGIGRFAELDNPVGVALSIGGYGVLFGLSYWRPVKERLQAFVVLFFFVGYCLDAMSTFAFGPGYSLASTLGNVVISYLALQLRFLPALSLATLASVVHLAARASAGAGEGVSVSEAELQLGIDAVFLLSFNLIAGFVAYQLERLVRDRFWQTELIADQNRELAATLAHMQAMETQLVEQEKQASLGKLVAGLLHEVRSPLGAVSSGSATIAGALDRCEAALRVGPAVPERQRAVEAIAASRKLLDLQRQGADRLDTLVRELKSFVGLDAGANEVLDLVAITETALWLLRDRLEAPVVVERDLGTGPVPIAGHPGELGQVVLAVLENAADALDGRGTLRVTLRVSERRALLEVRDSGPGIPPERLARIFEPALGRTRDRVKLQLGLATTRRIVERLGGEIRLVSDAGAGTLACIDLPLAERLSKA